VNRLNPFSDSKVLVNLWSGKEEREIHTLYREWTCFDFCIFGSLFKFTRFNCPNAIIVHKCTFSLQIC